MFLPELLTKPRLRCGKDKKKKDLMYMDVMREVLVIGWGGGR